MNATTLASTFAWGTTFKPFTPCPAHRAGSGGALMIGSRILGGGALAGGRPPRRYCRRPRRKPGHALEPPEDFKVENHRVGPILRTAARCVRSPPLGMVPAALLFPGAEAPLAIPVRPLPAALNSRRRTGRRHQSGQYGLPDDLMNLRCLQGRLRPQSGSVSENDRVIPWVCRADAV